MVRSFALSLTSLWSNAIATATGVEINFDKKATPFLQSTLKRTRELFAGLPSFAAPGLSLPGHIKPTMSISAPRPPAAIVLAEKRIIGPYTLP